jgi:3-deoxy-D-manno-octulosonate 8-phosphate phosphatase (KDO 8-P phosphatase)
MKKKQKPKFFILDVDGVITDGKMIYDSKGKRYKTFGPDDNDSLKVLKKYIQVYFVSGDKKGFQISKKRVNDMGFKISLVSAMDRVKWIDKKFGLNNCIYIGDGIFDYLVMRKVVYSIAPKNALDHVLKEASYVTKRKSGDRAVAEASIHILKKFFSKKITDIEKI